MKNKILYEIGLLFGLILLTVGLFIFLTWWSARAFFAIDLNTFEILGFLWILISIPIALIGLLLIIIFLFKNYPNNLKKSILGLLLILINIPVSYWVLDKQSDLDSRAYIKIYYKGIFDLSEVTLKGKNFEKKLGSLDCLTSKVTYFYPKYINGCNDSYPETDTVVLILKKQKNPMLIKLTLPRIDKGECKKLYIDKEYKLIDKWE